MIKYIYRHKKTGKKVITGEKLDGRQWEKIGERRHGIVDPKKDVNTHTK